jgi:hypothetical protein
MSKKMIQFLRDKADEYEMIGLGQYKRSAKQTDLGYTEFTNSRLWGDKARYYRMAANELEKEFKQ